MTRRQVSRFATWLSSKAQADTFAAVYNVSYSPIGNYTYLFDAEE